MDKECTALHGRSRAHMSENDPTTEEAAEPPDGVQSESCVEAEVAVVSADSQRVSEPTRSDIPRAGIETEATCSGISAANIEAESTSIDSCEDIIEPEDCCSNCLCTSPEETNIEHEIGGCKYYLCLQCEGGKIACRTCKETLRRNAKVVKCRICKGLFHKNKNKKRDCTGASEIRLKKEGSAGKWQCVECDKKLIQRYREKHPGTVKAGGQVNNGRTLLILQWNMDGIANKRVELEELMKEKHIDVAVIQETKVASGPNQRTITIPCCLTPSANDEDKNNDLKTDKNNDLKTQFFKGYNGELGGRGSDDGPRAQAKEERLCGRGGCKKKENRQPLICRECGKYWHIECAKLSQMCRVEEENKDSWVCRYCVKKKDTGGGLLTLIRRGIEYHKVDRPSHSTTELLSVELYLNGDEQLIITNVYRPPSQHKTSVVTWLAENDRELLLGDFNMHSEEWEMDCKVAPTDEVTGLLEWCKDSKYEILNRSKKEMTHLNRKTKKEGAIDLALVSPDLVGYFDLELLGIKLSSDHYPILVTYDRSRNMAEEVRGVAVDEPTQELDGLGISDDTAK